MTFHAIYQAAKTNNKTQLARILKENTIDSKSDTLPRYSAAEQLAYEGDTKAVILLAQRGANTTKATSAAIRGRHFDLALILIKDHNANARKTANFAIFLYGTSQIDFIHDLINKKLIDATEAAKVATALSKVSMVIKLIEKHSSININAITKTAYYSHLLDFSRTLVEKYGADPTIIPEDADEKRQKATQEEIQNVKDGLMDATLAATNAINNNLPEVAAILVGEEYGANVTKVAIRAAQYNCADLACMLVNEHSVDAVTLADVAELKGHTELAIRIRAPYHASNPRAPSSNLFTPAMLDAHKTRDPNAFGGVNYDPFAALKKR